MPESPTLTDTEPLHRVGVVLMRPKSPGNVGAVARAMKNMGFDRLILADPIRHDDPGWFQEEAARRAWDAADVLAARVEAPHLEGALAPFSLVIGTTSHAAAPARVLSPAGIAGAVRAHLASSRDATAAILLGQEDIGLTREAQSRCHLIGSIPSSHRYPSLNLSHAALLFLYELRLALIGGRDAPQIRPGATAENPEPVSQERMESFFGRLEAALESIEFFQGTARGHMMRELRALFNRAIISPRELAIFEGIIHRISLMTRR